VFTPPTRRNSAVSSRRRRRCVLDISCTRSSRSRPVTKAKLTASPRVELGELLVLSVSWRRLPEVFQQCFQHCFQSSFQFYVGGREYGVQLKTSACTHHHRWSFTAAVDVLFTGSKVDRQVVHIVLVTTTLYTHVKERSRVK